tara:strand:+ start:21111 stop:22346 length:1236 start_codon:yes stop_codon:yes gene_type:complete
MHAISSNPEGWSIVKIPEVLFFQEGPGVRKWQFTDGGVKLLNVGNINKGQINLDSTKIFISEDEAFDKYSHFLVDAGDLLIACSGIILDNFHNKISFAEQKHLPLCMNTSTMRFKALDENVIDLYFFKYFLQTVHFNKQLSRLITGSAQLNFGPSHIKKIDLFLPPLAEQQQIAAILDAADSLRQKDQQLIDHYTALSQSLFLDMFGSYFKNKSCYREISKVTNFIDYRGKTPERTTTGTPLISAKCVRTGYFDKSRLDFISSDVYRQVMTRGFPKVGDVLFTTEGATMGFTCRIPDGLDMFAVGQRLITLQSNESYNNTTLEFVLNSGEIQGEIFKQATGSAVKGIRSAKFAKILIPTPPIYIQNQFAERIQVIEAQKQRAQSSLEKSEALFNSLLQRAFSGELTGKKAA